MEEIGGKTPPFYVAKNIAQVKPYVSLKIRGITKPEEAGFVRLQDREASAIAVGASSTCGPPPSHPHRPVSRSSRSPLEAVKLSRIIPLPTAAAIKLELNTRLQLVDFTRVRQDEIEKRRKRKKESSRSEQFRETSTDERGNPTTNAPDFNKRFKLYGEDPGRVSRNLT